MHFFGKDRNVVTVNQLAARAATRLQAMLYKPFVTAVHRRGLPFVLGEANSASCGGQPNISDTFLSTLWAVDYMSEMSKVGVDAIYFHGNKAPYSPFLFISIMINLKSVPCILECIFLPSLQQIQLNG